MTIKKIILLANKSKNHPSQGGKIFKILFVCISCLFWQTKAMALDPAPTFRDTPTQANADEASNDSPQDDEEEHGYRFTLSWKYNGELYFGDIDIAGNAGDIKITTPAQQVLMQKIILKQKDKTTITLLTSDATFVDTNNPYNGYSPSAFVLSKDGDEWNITETCDDNKNCSSVSIMNAAEYNATE